jgi:hypothetical protein
MPDGGLHRRAAAQPSALLTSSNRTEHYMLRHAQYVLRHQLTISPIINNSAAIRGFLGKGKKCFTASSLFYCCFSMSYDAHSAVF